MASKDLGVEERQVESAARQSLQDEVMIEKGDLQDFHAAAERGHVATDKYVPFSVLCLDVRLITCGVQIWQISRHLRPSGGEQTALED